RRDPAVAAAPALEQRGELGARVGAVEQPPGRARPTGATGRARATRPTGQTCAAVEPSGRPAERGAGLAAPPAEPAGRPAAEAATATGAEAPAGARRPGEWDRAALRGSDRRQRVRGGRGEPDRERADAERDAGATDHDRREGDDERDDRAAEQD